MGGLSCYCGYCIFKYTKRVKFTNSDEIKFDYNTIGIGLVSAFQTRFEYQNKEKESTFNLRRIGFGARTYHASIGRFDRVDAMAEKMLSWSPYTFCFDNPIADNDGRFPYPISIRSFAPFKEFGGWFAGDSRGFSTSLSATSRLFQNFIMNTDNHTCSNLQASSSPSS